MKQLDNEDVRALREACRLAWEAQNALMMDSRLSPAAREQVKADAGATMRAWERIPDTFEATK